jgi:hypothetical protein
MTGCKHYIIRNGNIYIQNYWWTFLLIIYLSKYKYNTQASMNYYEYYFIAKMYIQQPIKSTKIKLH